MVWNFINYEFFTPGLLFILIGIFNISVPQVFARWISWPWFELDEVLGEKASHMIIQLSFGLGFMAAGFYMILH